MKRMRRVWRILSVDAALWAVRWRVRGGWTLILIILALAIAACHPRQPFDFPLPPPDPPVP